MAGVRRCGNADDTCADLRATVSGRLAMTVILSVVDDDGPAQDRVLARNR